MLLFSKNKKNNNNEKLEVEKKFNEAKKAWKEMLGDVDPPDDPGLPENATNELKDLLINAKKNGKNWDEMISCVAKVRDAAKQYSKFIPRTASYATNAEKTIKILEELQSKENYDKALEDWKEILGTTPPNNLEDSDDAQKELEKLLINARNRL